QYFFSIYRPKVFLLGFVGRKSERHLPFDHRDRSISKAYLIVGVDDGSKADSCSVGQIPGRYIGTGPDPRVVASCGVANERVGPAGGVVVACGVVKERQEPVGRVAVTRGVAKQRIDSAGGVV